MSRPYSRWNSGYQTYQSMLGYEKAIRLLIQRVVGPKFRLIVTRLCDYHATSRFCFHKKLWS